MSGKSAYTLPSLLLVHLKGDRPLATLKQYLFQWLRQDAFVGLEIAHVGQYIFAEQQYSGSVSSL